MRIEHRNAANCSGTDSIDRKAPRASTGLFHALAWGQPVGWRSLAFHVELLVEATASLPAGLCRSRAVSSGAKVS
jgi:hypothetical protein